MSKEIYCTGCGEKLIKVMEKLPGYDSKTGKRRQEKRRVCPKSDTARWKENWLRGLLGGILDSPFMFHIGDYSYE